MELLKKHIRRNDVCVQETLQFTMDEDVNVGDAWPDIGAILAFRGEVQHLEERVSNGRCYLSGGLSYQLLYRTEDGAQTMAALTGELPFEEMLAVGEDADRDGIFADCVLENLSISMIHSRKYKVKAMLRLSLTGRHMADEECLVQVLGEPTLQSLYEDVTMSELVVCKKESCRWKEGCLLPNGKPEIQKILMGIAELSGGEVRLQHEQFQFRGVLHLFLVYEGFEAGEPVTDWYTAELPLSLQVPLSGIREDQIPDIRYRLSSYEITAEADSDGEQRMLQVTGSIGFDVIVYEEKTEELLRDVYATEREVTPTFQTVACEQLLGKNSAKIRLQGKLTVPEGQPRMARELFLGGEVLLDETTMAEGGILAEGVLSLCGFYLAGDDSSMIYAIRGELPFSELLAVDGVLPASEEASPDCYEVRAYPDQITMHLLDAEELEAKAVVSFEVVVRRRKSERLMVDVSSREYTEEELAQLPTMSCRYVQRGERLWDIAKESRVSLERIRLFAKEPVKDPLPAGIPLLIVPESRGQKQG